MIAPIVLKSYQIFLLKELSADGDNGELLSDYSTMTPQRTLTASATPAPATDAINRQAQHIMALNETESALKGNLHFILGHFLKR